ncbi:MAG: hypothetical protein A4E32_02138 [Methanomassiliicoccales archaeon PtaU1.Bin124]|nr:MAG: hypothetical protein A4E32_02138 [Methanomassiliicoccales archaeon PtaU1.Bin124]
MMPDHCKDVSLREVDFPLTEDNINASIAGKKAYTRTDFMILRGDNETAVIRVHKQPGKDLFRPISSVDIISMPGNTVFIRDESVDVLNLSALATMASRYPGKTVVVSGMFNHVSFLKPETILHLRVFDVVPPSPSKLSVLVERALSCGLVELPLVLEVVDIDLNEKERAVRTGTVMFPCRASGLRSYKNVLYLDETPDIPDDVTLIGCDLSRRIFGSIYGKEAEENIDICPRNIVKDDGTKTIIKCCKVKEGHEVNGNVASVPWGATTMEVAGAIKALFS